MCVSKFSNCELLALANTLAITIKKNFSNEDALLLATFFTVLGDNLALLTIEKE